MTHEQINNLFKQPYNQTGWKQFLAGTFFNASFWVKPEILTGIDSNVASQVQKLGHITLEENGIERHIVVYDVTLASGIILERNRVGLRNLLRKYWKNIDAAFVAFHQPESSKWRFTYISELNGYDADGQFMQIVTEPKRYTYVLGEGESTRTAIERFTALAAKGRNITLDDVKETFSVEKLSKAFFDDYKKHYDGFCAFMLSKPNISQTLFNGNEKGIRDFNKKLLGRLVFLYFIQKKGWLGVPATQDWGNGDLNFLSNRFENFKDKDLFYSEFLSPLFFETLNQKREHDIAAFLNTKNADKLKIPYLNGGLFEEDDKKHRNLIFTANLFEDLFKFFNQYNFTIYEDDPSDHTVAVDPEMLGHIFENLLEDNKDKGAYYTPKEIVHYMCQESLIEYLTTWFENKGYEIVGYSSLGKDHLPELFPINESRKGQMILEIDIKSTGKQIDRVLIEKLLKKKLNEDDKKLVKQHANEFHSALDNVKICDPAIGSGAFPMGLLHEIFTAKQTLHAFEYGNTKNFDASTVKLNIIQNSIYGVDIERGAVDIARLRFWLSLIVDEPKPKALPNLDYKIVVGNSLVSKLGDDIIDIDWALNETSHGLFGADLAKQKSKLLKKISQEQKEYFSPDSDKKKLAADIRNLKIDLLINQLELMVKTKGIETQPAGTGKKIKEQTELYLQTVGWKNSIKDLQTLKNKPEAPLLFFDWKLDFPEVMNPLVFDNNNSHQVEVANAQILALNKQIDAINVHLEQYHIDTHLIHLQTNIAQGQIAIIKNQLQLIEQKIKDFFGKINTIENGIANEPDSSFNYTISSINQGINEINQRIEAINPQINQLNPKIGFDIVIGNPPYVRRTALDDNDKLHFEKTFESAYKQYDLYILFIENSTKLLKEKGCLTFINPNKFFSSDYGFKLRKFLLDYTSITKILDISQLNVFENALTYPCILFIQKGNNQKSIIQHAVLENLIFDNIEFALFSQIEFKQDSYHFFIFEGDRIKNRIIQKIETDTKQLGNYFETARGLPNSKIEFSDKKSISAIKSTSVKKYKIDDVRINIRIIEERLKNKYESIFKNELVIMPRTVKFLQATLKPEKLFLLDRIYYLSPKQVDFSAHDVLALLNSKLLTFWFEYKYSSSKVQGGYLDLRGTQISAIPIKTPSSKFSKFMKKTVLEILNKKSQNQDTTALEQEIDNLVYRLYELTYEEVKVIDPEFSLSKEFYEGISLE